MYKLIFTSVIILLCSIASAQTFSGTASFYHNKFNGRKTATGEVFDNQGLTCACNKIKLGTIVRVTNLSNGKSIELRVNDRLSVHNKRTVDVTVKAAKQLGFYNAGLCKVKVEVIEKKTLVGSESEQILNRNENDSKKDTIFTTE